MRQKLLLLLSLLISTIAMAQTTWTGGGANTNWNNIDNWDTNLVPTASDDVIIPDGFTVTLNVAGNVKSIDVQGNSIFDINTNLTFSEPSTFGVDTTVNWNQGTLNGTGSVLTNSGTISTATSNVSLASGTTLTNDGNINLAGVGDIFILVGAVLNNGLTGVIDFQADDSGISESGLGVNLLNNFGLIKTSFATADSADQATISVELKNNDGTLQVEVGILNLSNATQDAIELTGGEYNVFADAALEFDSSVTLSGTLTGALTGDLIWRSNLYVNSSNTATFNFTDNATVSWVGGNLLGGGTLINESTLKTVSTNVLINQATTFQNNASINLTGVADIFIGPDSILNNTASGIIDFQADDSGISESGAGVNLLTNSGLIKTSFVTADSTDQATIGVELKNNDGTLQVEVGILNLSNPTQDSIELTDGVYNVSADSALEFDSSVTLSGTLTGALTGDLVWRSNLYVNSSNTATFNFTDNATVSWVAGSLLGGGTLINESTINTLATNVFIIGVTTLTNNTNINFTGVADIFIGPDSILNNTATGIIDFQTDDSGISESGSGVNLLNNSGLIKTSFTTADPTDQATIGVELKNNDGTLQVEVGTLNLSNPSINSIELTDGVYNVFADAALDFDSSITLSGTLTGTLTGYLNWRSNVYVNSPNTATFNFSGNETVSWVNGSLLGAGTLINESTISTLATNVFIIGATTLTNNSNINLIGVGDIFIGPDSVLDNTASGIIDFQANNSGISESGAGVNLLTNFGLIKTSFTTADPTDQATIGVELKNNDGTLQVEVGTLNLSNPTQDSIELIDGVYNVFADAAIDFDSSITLSGTLTGTLTGDLNWRSNVYVNSPNTATFNFTGSATVSWSSGSLLGGGILVNESIINNTNNVFINEATTLTNNDTFNLIGSADIFIGVDSVLNNLASGTIDFQANNSSINPSGSGFHLVNNSGLLKTSAPISAAAIGCDVTNSGTIEITSGILNFTGTLDHQPTGIVKGIGSINLPAIVNFTNNGTFSPGVSPGTLTVFGNYTSTPNTVLDIELNGLMPDTDHDVLAIIGTSVVLEGTVDVTMGFDAEIGDEFTIATTTGSITTANLQSPIEMVDLDGKRYTFDISYPDDNKVVLTITDKVDILPPNVVTQDITVQLDNTGNVSILPSDIDNGSADNCSLLNELIFSLDIDSFTCADLGDNTVNLTVTDIEGNFASAPAIVTVEDNVLPIVLTQDITVQLDASGAGSIEAAAIDDGSSDNCGIASLSLDMSDFDCSDVGTNTVTLTVTDVNGNSNTGTAIVTVEDNVDPVVVTQDIIVQLDGSGNASITPAMIDDGSTDNCGIAGSSLDITSFTTDDLGPNTVTLTVTDINGNFSSATAIVTVEAGTDLVTAIAQDITVQLDTNGEATITAADVDDGSSVVSGTLNLSIDVTEFDCSDLGPNTVTLTVSDGNGNSANAIAVVTVEDNILPTVVIQDITVQLDTSGNASITSAMIDNGSSDNCGIASLSVDTTSFDCSNVGSNTVTLTVTDINGNVNTGIATVTVEDNVLPTVVTQDITVQLDVSGNASITPAMVDDGSFDSCGLASLSLDETDFDVTDIGPNTVTLTVTDNNGNSNSAAAIVTVEQATDLVNAVTKDITVQLDANGQVSITPEDVDNGSTVESGTPILSLDVSSFDCSNIGANTVTLTVTDQSSNSDSATAIVTVEDVTAPTVVTQDITIQLDGFGNASITPAMIDNGSFDNCEIESYSLDVSSFTTSDLGENTVTLTVTDQSSNSDSATAIVTVEENDGTPNTLAFQEVFTGRGLVSGSVAFADVDGDNDQDVVLSGALRISATGISGPLFSDLFKNDGNGNFTQVLGGAPFMGLAYSSVSFRDLNNDNILDVISTGENITTGNNFDNFYTNDGTGRFSQVPGFAFTNLERKDFKFADLDGDSEDDLLIIGEDNNGIPRVKLFESQGSSFLPQSNNLPNVLFGSIAVGDVNGDNLTDIFISGQLTNGTKIAEIYINNSNFQFSLLPATSFEGLDKGDSSFADVDNDGDQDLLISGQNSNMDNILKLYLNDGTGSFTEAVGIINLSSNIFMQAFEFADVDGDSDLDVLMTGYNTVNYRPVTKIWENLLVSPIAPRSDENTSSNFAVNFIDSNLEFGLGFRVFPNPTDRGYFDIETPGLEGEISITMSDAQGRIVLSQNNFVTNNHVKVYTKDVLGGLYIVTIKKGKSIFTAKLIVH